jgi:hypothetical protein
MWYLNANILQGGDERIFWDFHESLLPDEADEGRFTINFGPRLRTPADPRRLLRTLREILAEEGIDWIAPNGREWLIDLDALCSVVPQFEAIDWARGKVSVQPEFDTGPSNSRGTKTVAFTSKIIFYLLKEDVQRNQMLLSVPVEISKSIEAFRRDHPDASRVAFIMMEFGGKTVHASIVDAIKHGLSEYSIKGVRADEKMYHDDLYWNVMTYLHGCGLGIAVFERIRSENFNPNVSLEVGYMFALRKPVCLLKDETLTSLHSDIVGKLYSSFDILDPANSIPPRIARWLADKELRAF